MASRVIPSEFSDYERSDHIWNMYTIPFSHSNPKSLRAEAIRNFKDNPNVNFPMIKDNLVT